MSDSILTGVKDYLAIESHVTAFDQEILTYINSAIATLSDVSDLPFTMVEDDSATWGDIGADGFSPVRDAQVKMYVKGSVKLMFDPPSNLSGVDALKELVNEHLWRIKMEHERRTTDHSKWKKNEDD